MPHTIRTFVCTVLAIAFAASAASAQKLPPKKEAKEWLRKAAADADLRGSGGAPFHLVAHFKYTLDRKSVV
jgi:hypothetical protein